MKTNDQTNPLNHLDHQKVNLGQNIPLQQVLLILMESNSIMPGIGVMATTVTGLDLIAQAKFLRQLIHGKKKVIIRLE